MGREDPADGARGKVVLAVVVAVVTWPAWAGFRLAMSIRFGRVVHRARGNRCTLLSDGIEVRKNGGPAQHVSWQELAEARWLEHLEPDAGFDRERLAVSIARKGLALSDEAGDLRGILEELARRGVKPRLGNGGRGSSMGDGPLWLVWLIGGAVAIVVWGLSGGWRR